MFEEIHRAVPQCLLPRDRRAGVRRSIPTSGERQKEVRYRVLTDNRRARRQRSPSARPRQSAQVDHRHLKDWSRQKAHEKVTLRLRLQRAGLGITPKVYWLASALCGVTLAFLVIMLLPSSITRQFLAVVVGLVGTFGVPRWFVNKITARRQNKFSAELANAIDIVTRGMKSGLPLNECLSVISRESEEPLAGEFREVVEQQRVGVSLGEALDRLTTRMPMPEVKYLAIVVAIQQQAGGNLSEALGNLAGVLRDRFRLKMKVKALSAEAKASALVLASLPPLVMFMVYGTSPDYISPLFDTRTGNLMLLFSAFWMLIGVL
jgi:tight adherence protein B